RAMQAEHDRHVAAGGVDHQARHGHGADAPRPAGDEDLGLLFKRFDPADAAADDDAAAERVFAAEVQARILDGGMAGRQAELPEAIDALGFAGIDAVPGDVEGGALAADARGHPAGIPAGDRTDPALAGAQVFPQLIAALAQRGDAANSGNDDTTLHRCGAG